MFDCPRLIMANTDGLMGLVKGYLEELGAKKIMYLRSLVSSPRLMDHFVRGFDTEIYALVGDSFLDLHTMLGDYDNKTYGVSLVEWGALKDKLEVVDSFSFRDTSVSRVQVWAFDPKDLDHDSMRIAVACSYHDLELIREPRIFGAIEDLLTDLQIDADPF